ncbi:PilZ domain-containing protein [Paraburkholderia tropica]|uniref:PilZ domain-containing protein n=1 Tax=Paraburkholderia tropica TaxID=92647 RepID=A0AAQ1GLC0_9BURK|nr:PilZ domain-containing protein [Paraburkholderia tropica]RQN35827.1 PilZ domain-containing protein [Paraburkholderia tropica]SEK09880.1 PilZ domain-containing protein [Paraburkholderia tropica]
MGSERDFRRDVRTPMLFAPLLLNKDGRALAQVADLSSHGALLHARSGLFSRGETVSGWLQSSAVDGEDEIVVAVFLDVRWIAEDHERGWSRVGCEMHTLDARSMARLHCMIEKAAP